MNKKEKVKAIYEILDKEYKDAKCTLNYSSPFELVVAVMLSAQCTDERVNIVTKDLFKKYKSVYEFKRAKIEELTQIIRPCGFYKTKGENIIKTAKKVCDNFNGEVPDNIDDLLTLDGIGRKSANLILGEIYAKEAYVVDTHAIRLTNRFGLVNTKDPQKIEMLLRKIVEPKISLKFCHFMVSHGRAVCKARGAMCENCVVSDLCSKKNLKKVKK